MAGRTELEFTFRTKPVAERTRTAPQGPFRILVLSDLSGRANRGISEPGASLASRPVVRVDVDSFERVLANYAPQLQLGLAEAPEGALTLTFKRLEDFHPDHLYRSVALFDRLRDIRKGLLNPNTFEATAAELGPGNLQSEPAEPAQATPSAPPEPDNSMFERLLGRAPEERPHARARVGGAQVDLEAMIRNIVAPHVVNAPDKTRQDAYVQSVDEAVSYTMREILHQDDFRQLEAAWLSLWQLVNGFDPDAEVQVWLMDVSREELELDLLRTDVELSDTGLYQRVVEQEVGTLGGQGWAVILADLAFGPDPQELSLLSAVGAVASHAGGPVLAAARPRLLGCDTVQSLGNPRDWAPKTEDAARWETLRQSPSAAWIGLATARLLLRLPYGKRHDPIEAFDFEELLLEPQPEALLWANPCFALGALLAQDFADAGWQMSPGGHLDIDDLPTYIFEQDGERQMQPCAEVWLTEKAMTEILGQGVMPLLSHRHLNAARLARFQSISDPAKGLAGRWG